MQADLFSSNDVASSQGIDLKQELAGLPAGWRTMLDAPPLPTTFERIQRFLAEEQAAQKTLYPATPFRALSLTAPEQVKVVILGQDPYHGPGQAHGLSFSVQEGVKVPPSLRNIFKELQRDLGVTVPAHGNLTRWAEQGVLLLNTVLTVRDGEAGSHRKQGWEQVTDALIHGLATQREHLVFLLWGSDAQAKKALLPDGRHLVLEAPHPSPLSAHRGFLGCGHFSTANRYLAEHGLSPIQW